MQLKEKEQGRSGSLACLGLLELLFVCATEATGTRFVLWGCPPAGYLDAPMPLSVSGTESRECGFSHQRTPAHVRHKQLTSGGRL